MKHLQGLYTALITPFYENGSIDIEGLIQLIHLQLRHQVDGLVILGTTAEVLSLTQAEKELIISQTVKTVNGQVPVVVGTGSPSTWQTIEETKQAQEMGAQAALIVTPYYNKPSQEGVYRHFALISEHTFLPYIVYNNPGRAAVNLSPSTLKKIAQLPRVIGIKEASGQMSQIIDILELLEDIPHLNLMAGDDALTYSMMTLGASGVISVTSNLVPSLMQELVQSCLAGSFLQAREQHFKLYPLFKKLFVDTNPVPLKAAMQYLKLPSGPCRLPLCSLSAAHFEELKTALSPLVKCIELATL